MRLAIDHVTTYRFAQPITQGMQRLRLTPVTGKGQSVVEWAIDLVGARAEAGYDDENGNRVTLVAITPGVEEVTIRAHGVVDTTDEAGVVGRHVGYLPLWHFTRETELTKVGPKIEALIEALADRTTSDRLATLHALTALIRDAVAYETGHTDVATSAEAVLAAGHGVCQDHAHVFIASARALGIPARYVSGYLLMDDRVEQDAGHGWAEAFVEGLGWVGFDVANAVCPDARYVRVATGRDYVEAAPVKGLTFTAFGDAESDETLTVELSILQVVPA
ncbi:transglutaminase-like protein [Novosphingobium nitrogenifigens DSM 19370]|uniref:Transglutaminase-like protein n=1 Tax=Novosphingobium nitrogenifigens DSM 19370 TaxID=983920 RepID=F1ZCZ2_9SPHN|nr:transglutaminase family protein [Novosphingobium nitrogenifigens]EGD57521.1 transglutaminase-like protein [Novosphingobium nitrogenifigens DSM 19370]